MFIKKGEFKNFRNLKYETIEFSEAVNFITGNNGSGKTNIIEAISIVSNLKSFRSASDIDLINWESNGYFIYLNVFSDIDESYEIGCLNISGKIRKKYKISGMEKNKIHDYYGKFITIVFSPDDIILIDGAPEIKRRYFDSVISKIDKEYMLKLYDFRKVLSYRNNILKSIKFAKSDKNIFEELDIWDDLFIDNALILMEKRKTFIDKFRDYFYTSYSCISQNNDSPFFYYESSLKERDKGKIKNELLKNRNMDINYGSTTKGPHRDVYYFKDINNRNFINYCSQGQKRTASIALKNAEKEFIEFQTQKKTILLVDDIFSELDNERKKNMIELLNKGNQVLFTMVSVEKSILNSFEGVKIFNVENGLISEKK
jgi:DNA replication and repair protein RecF